VGAIVTTDCVCVFAPTVPAVGTVMWNVRFCQNRLLSSTGLEKPVFPAQFGYDQGFPAFPVGQVVNAVPPVGLFNVRNRMLNGSVTRPAGSGPVVVGMLLQPVPVCGLHPGGGLREFAAPPVCNSTPAEAVVSFEITVLLMKLEAIASCIDTPPPVHPATLLAIMLLVMLTWNTLQRPALNPGTKTGKPSMSPIRPPT